MTVALWISMIGQFVIGVLAGLGAASYIIFRKHVRPDLRDLQDDVDALYLGHGLEPPSSVRFRRDHPEEAAKIRAQAASEVFGPMDDRMPDDPG